MVYCRNAHKVQTQTELQEWDKATHYVHEPEFEFVVMVLFEDDEAHPWDNGWFEEARFGTMDEAIAHTERLNEFVTTTSHRTYWIEQETEESQYGRYVEEAATRRW